MRCRHAMPFGAELSAAGARFRLWAPAARQVELDLAVHGSRR
jgi:maltooligosyltrehalose trehalohydrolase